MQAFVHAVMMLQQLPLNWEVGLAVLGSSSVSASLSMCDRPKVERAELS